MITTCNTSSHKGVNDLCVCKKQAIENWYVFYTAPRAEKVLKEELLFLGYDVFLPVFKNLKVWKNRQKKMIEEVLFPSYIFVKTTERELSKICNVSKIYSYVHCANKPCKVNANCIEGIKQMLNLNLSFSIDNDLAVGERVRITDGPLTGYEGILILQNGKFRFGIQLEVINRIVYVDIQKTVLERLE